MTGLPMIEVRAVPTQVSRRACVAELSRSLVQGGAAQPRRPARRTESRAARLHQISATHPARKPRCSAHPVSSDSRYWGPIKGSSIIGKVMLVWWHGDHPYFRRF